MEKNRPGGLTKAVSGFAVIVLGVLVALAGDRWNQDRQERHLEADYLAGLIGDLLSDSVRMEDEIALTLMGEEGARQALRALQGGAPESDLDSVTWMDLLGPSAQPRAASWTFDELRTAGNVRLISAHQLRRTLFEYYGVAEFQRERMTYIQSLGRDAVSGLMWSGGGPFSDASVRDLTHAAEGEAMLERLVSYHVGRRLPLEAWLEYATQALIATRSASGG